MVSLSPVALPALAAALVTSVAAVPVVLSNGPTRPPAAIAVAGHPGGQAALPLDGAAAAVVTPGPAAAAPRPPVAGSRTAPASASALEPGSERILLRLAAARSLSRPNDPGGPAAAPPAARPGSPVPATGSWRWPLDPAPTVLRRFQVGPFTWSRGHRGVDLAARPGAQVLSPAAGVVTYAGTLANRGVMVVTYPSGLRATFEPVWPIAQVGRSVSSGEAIGIVEAGYDHCGTTPCLHWGALSGSRYLDPLLLVGGARPAVLLPLLQ